MKRALRATGIDRSVIQRLGTGRAADVKGATLERMRAYLSTASAERIA
jgi:DNA-binding Xre family transcriptional regulator